MGESELRSVNNVKDLGVTISKHFKFEQHYNNIVKSAGIKMNCIFRYFECKEPKFQKRLFTTFIRPRLEYASEIWSPQYLKDIDMIESVQRQFTRRIPKMRNRNLSYTERLSKLDLESLEMRRIKMDLVMIYKMLHGIVDLNFEDFFTLNNDSRTRNNGYKISFIHHALDIKKHFFTNRPIRIWNSLPNSVVSSRTVASFKLNLSKPETNQILANFIKGRAL